MSYIDSNLVGNEAVLYRGRNIVGMVAMVNLGGNSGRDNYCWVPVNPSGLSDYQIK